MGSVEVTTYNQHLRTEYIASPFPSFLRILFHFCSGCATQRSCVHVAECGNWSLASAFCHNSFSPLLVTPYCAPFRAFLLFPWWLHCQSMVYLHEVITKLSGMPASNHEQMSNHRGRGRICSLLNRNVRFYPAKPWHSANFNIGHGLISVSGVLNSAGSS